MAEAKGQSVVQAVSLGGSWQGLVKRLDAFDKSRHTAPKFASERAGQFLSRLVEAELIEWGDELLRSLRRGLGYKRRELALEVAGGLARIAGKDFVLSRQYSLLQDSPDTYEVETELGEIESAHLLEVAEFNEAVGPLFDRMRFLFRRENSVERLIDVLEEDEDGLGELDYPHDCAYCELRLPDCAATFRFDAVSLELRFAHFGSPGQMVAAYERLRTSLAGHAAGEWMALRF